MLHRESLRALAFEFGFDHCALSPLTIPEKDRAAYLSWCEDGHAAGMAYMSDDPSSRLNPAIRFDGARSVLSLGVSYHQGPLPPKPGPGFGRVARYAWGEDYHPLILKRLEALIERLPEVFGASVRAQPAIDTRPLLERALARQAGLGFVGKNTVLIMPRSPSLSFHVGSFVFLAEILLDVDVDGTDAPPSVGCGNCTRCGDICPTGALSTPYRLDANRCIAYLTIENKGAIPVSMRAGVGDWLFGCDLCQDVCPFNAGAFETRWPEFRADRGVGAWVSLADILSVEKTNFKARYGATPFARAKRRGMIRNACVVAGNSGDESLSPRLAALLGDEEPLIRGHALWALSRLSPSIARDRAELMAGADTDAGVKAEAAMILEGFHV